ncbi:MAG: caspase family protein, partial [Ferruginibacter sp.]|nr:caspase family protein [Chitinophagaceae bacterium]
MLSRCISALFFIGWTLFQPVHGQQPRLVIPKGFFMVSAGLNGNGDLVTLSAANKLNVWNLDSFKLRYSVHFNTSRSYNVHYSPNGKFIIAPDTRDSTTIIDAASGKTLFTLDGWIQDILKKEISPDGNSVITTPFKNKVAKVWDLNTGRLLQTLTGHESAVTYSAYSHNGKIIVTGSQDNTIKLWNAQSGALLHTLDGHTGAIFYACFSDDDKYVASASYDGTSKIFEVSTGKLVSTLTGHQSLVMDVAFSRDNKYMITCSRDKTAAYWEMISGKKLFSMNGHTDDVLTCRFSNDEQTVITTSSDGSLKEWVVPGGRIIKTIAFTGGYGTYSIYRNKLILCNEDRINLYSYPGLKKDYSLLPLDSSNYLVLDSSGRYDGTEPARKLLYFTCGTEIINLEQAKDQLWVPNLAERITHGEIINAKTLEELNICGLTPEVKDVSSQPGEYLFKITPRRGGLGETILLVNGIEVKRYKAEQLKKNAGIFELVIKKEELSNFFAAGKDNPVTVRAYTADNTISSRGVIIRENKTDKITTPPNLYAVMVGVSDYKGDELDLKYAAKDATDISSAVAAAAGKLLNTDGKQHVFMYNLTTAKEHYLLPEKKSIKETLVAIGKKATANDILLLFFAGHGVMEGKEKQFYFLTSDASKMSAADAIAAVGISTAELTEWMKPQNIKAQKRILIFDACNSGQAIKDFVKLGNNNQDYLAARNDDNARQIKEIDKLNEKSGLFILSASASDQ